MKSSLLNRALSALSACALLVTATPAAAGSLPLPQDAGERAATCMVAAMLTEKIERAPNGRLSFAAVTPIVHFMMVRSAARPDETDADMGHAVADTMLKLKLDGDAAAVMTACASAFPQAVAEHDVRLPTGGDDRLLLCAFFGARAAGLYRGVSRGQPYPEGERYYVLMTRLVSLKGESLQAAGKRTGHSRNQVFQIMLDRGLALGRVDKVLDACVAAFPPQPAP
jgi:hypothetical protein